MTGLPRTGCLEAKDRKAQKGQTAQFVQFPRLKKAGHKYTKEGYGLDKKGT